MFLTFCVGLVPDNGEEAPPMNDTSNQNDSAPPRATFGGHGVSIGGASNEN